MKQFSTGEEISEEFAHVRVVLDANHLGWPIGIYVSSDEGETWAQLATKGCSIKNNKVEGPEVNLRLPIRVHQHNVDDTSIMATLDSIEKRKIEDSEEA